MKSTALKQFQRLEAPGSWRPSPDEQLREVVVSIGEATLILSDPKSDAPLAHWSLPAVERLNSDHLPAIYSPAAAEGDKQFEILEISDQWMVDAISHVQTAIAARRAHPGRLRSHLMLAALAAMILGAIIWLPSALRSHAVRITPQAEEIRIGKEIITDMSHSTGAPCYSPEAAQVVTRLIRRTGLSAKIHLVVLRHGLDRVIMLPGRLGVVGDTLIADQDGPEALAGHLIAAELSAEANDPMSQVIRRVDFFDVLRLLMSGSLPEMALQGIGEEILATSPARPDDKMLLSALAKAQLPSSPYAETLPDTAAPPVTLLDGDPFLTEAYPPILSDRDWVTLQQLCTGREHS